MELLGESGINPLSTTTQHGVVEEEAHFFKEQNQHQQQQHGFNFDNLMLDDFNYELPALQPTHAAFEEIHEGQKNQLVGYNKQVPLPVPLPSSLASLELLRNYGSRFKGLRGQNILTKTQTCASPKKLSSEDIIRLAGARVCCLRKKTEMMNLLSFSLQQLRLERVGCQQFQRANVLLSHFHHWNNSSVPGGVGGSPVQRVVFHFAQALRERINKETGGGGRVLELIKGSDERLRNEERELIEKLELDTNIAITCHQKLPFNQVMQFAGVQAIVEHVASKSKIHLIDLDIGCGVMCTCFMQALAERQEDNPVELLKITAIGFYNKTKKLEETGKSLMSFAESLNFPLLYNTVFVNDIMEIKVEQFEIEEDEAVAIYSPYLLRTMVSNSDDLENLMMVIRRIKPCIMIVLEVEANHNSPSFVNRFVEALFFYSAYFDCIETCMKQDHEYECRVRLEAILSEGIRNIVAMEDGEWTVRNVRIDVWRRFFARYRMVETGFSESSMYQANVGKYVISCY